MTAAASFVERFHLWIDKRKCTADTVYMRSAISSEEEAFEFVNSFSATTGTEWVIHQGRPKSPKYVFVKTWVCSRSWNIKSESSSPEDKCIAKIQIQLKKINPSANKMDAYLNHNPPLCGVIRLSGKHSHTSVVDDSFQMSGLTPELKERFFKYFQIGLSATEARTQHEIVISTLKNEKKILTHFSNLTSRQAQRLYNHWENVKDTIAFSKENTNSTIQMTYEELLKAIPKKLPQSPREPTLELNTNLFSGSNGVQAPLVFVCVDSTVNSPFTDGRLLYNLKYGTQQTFVSRLTVPPISLVRIESRESSWEKELLLNQSSIEDVSIKLEPIDYDDESESPMYGISGNVYEIPTTPIDCPDVSAGGESCVFPLVFTSTGLTSSTSDNDAPLLYSLTYGPQGSYADALSTPNILAVQIPSMNQTTLNIKNAFSNTEVTLDSHVQVERIKTEIEDMIVPLSPQIITGHGSMPVILDVSSCEKKMRKERTKKSPPYQRILPDLLRNKRPVEAPLPLKPSELKDDEDYRFLMSLLPQLKQMPPEEKKQVKKKMQDFVISSRLAATKVKFQKSLTSLRRNIYQDCGTLPSFRF